MLVNRLRRAEEGFTLIELLVVVAIIALLAMFAMPKLFEAINKSKKAPGQADMQTISSALERYYLDQNTYPIGSAANTITSALGNGYLKAGTTYKNGFGLGYIYVSDAAGSFYVLIDGQNTPAATNLTLTCNSKTQTVNTGATGLSVVQVSGASAIGASDVASGCTVSGAATGTTVQVVTN
jgi:type II secretion system protein G